MAFIRIFPILLFIVSCTEVSKVAQESSKSSPSTSELCQSFQVCGLRADGASASCRPGQTCLYLKVCKTAICIEASKACELECGSGVKSCAIQESFPGRLGCPKS